jgi:hypothetical protein
MYTAGTVVSMSKLLPACGNKPKMAMAIMLLVFSVLVTIMVSTSSNVLLNNQKDVPIQPVPLVSTWSTRQGTVAPKGYLMPTFVSAGANNFKMEIRRSVLMAHELNRYLCIPKIQPASKASGFRVRKRKQLSLADFYDTAKLEEFVSLLPETNCTDYANASVLLRCSSSGPSFGLQQDDYSHLSEIPLIILHGCLWPERPYTADRVLWQYLMPPKLVSKHAHEIIRLSSHIQLGNFTSFHWRFEEEKCARVSSAASNTKPELGLCFRVNPLLHNLSSTLLATEQEIVAAIAAEIGSGPLFLATDGRLRGSGDLVDRVKEKNPNIRSRL